MIHTYTTQDGKTAVPVNPYVMTEPFKGDINSVQPEEVLNRLKNLRDFDCNNPPLPLTTERPDLIGKEFEGEVVEQGSDDKINWYCEDLGYYQYFRQAISVPVKGEEKVHDDEQKDIDSWKYMDDLKAAFEAGEDFNNDCHCGNCSYCDDIKERDAPNFEQWYLERFGHWRNPDTHATNDANLVPLDKVINELECCKELTKIDIDVLIQRIKNLTKE